MTVCIVAASSSLKRIITVSDKMLSSDYASSDDALFKSRTLTLDQRWHYLFAAVDTSRVISLHDRITATLATVAQPASLEHVIGAVEGAYVSECRHLAEMTFLAPFGMTLTEFMAEGRSRLGSAFQKLLTKIQAVDTTVQMLIFGFDPSGELHILKTSTLGVVSSGNIATFDAIGSGAAVATDFLLGAGKFTEDSDIGEIIYRLCEAKFTAEGALGVGKETVVYSVSEDGVAFHFRAAESARKLWDRRRKAKIPENTLTNLRRELSVDSKGREHFEIATESVMELLNTYDSVRRRLETSRARKP